MRTKEAIKMDPKIVDDAALPVEEMPEFDTETDTETDSSAEDDSDAVE